MSVSSMVALATYSLAHDRCVKDFVRDRVHRRNPRYVTVWGASVGKALRYAKAVSSRSHPDSRQAALQKATYAADLQAVQQPLVFT